MHDGPIEQIRKSLVRNEDLARHSRLLKNESEEEKRDDSCRAALAVLVPLVGERLFGPEGVSGGS